MRYGVFGATCGGIALDAEQKRRIHQHAPDPGCDSRLEGAILSAFAIGGEQIDPCRYR